MAIGFSKANGNIGKRRGHRNVIRQLGLTLTEVGLAVAVSGIIIVAGLAIYSSVSFNAKVQSVYRQWVALNMVAANVASSRQGVFSMIGNDQVGGFVASNPWGGSTAMYIRRFYVASPVVVQFNFNGVSNSDSTKVCKVINKMTGYDLHPISGGGDGFNEYGRCISGGINGFRIMVVVNS